MSDAAGESLMRCTFCFDLLPQKDLVYHINYECRIASGHMLSEEDLIRKCMILASCPATQESSFGHYEPQYGSRGRKGSYSHRIFSPNYSSPLTLHPFKPALSCPNSAEIKNQSSTTQAGVPASIIDKENPKYEELSSLNAKDVTLLIESMKELLIKGSDHDVTIIVKDKQFQAHRIILKTRSPVFAMMLTHDSKESSTGTIKIEDCDPGSFDEFLLYLYSGRTENLTPAKAVHLYYTADKYDIPLLKERCVILLKTSLSVEFICDVILLATRHNEKELLEEATKFFAQNMREILVTVHWQEFLSKNPIEGNELYIKSVDFLVPRK